MTFTTVRSSFQSKTLILSLVLFDSFQRGTIGRVSHAWQSKNYRINHASPLPHADDRTGDCGAGVRHLGLLVRVVAWTNRMDICWDSGHDALARCDCSFFSLQFAGPE